MAHFALFAKRVPPIPSLHRHGLHVATLIQNRLIRALPLIHSPHYNSHASSHHHTRCPNTDLPTPTSPVSVAVAVRQQRYRDQIDRSLEKLKLKDLSSLALATGQPLSGTKTMLMKRISACLAAVMVDIDHFQDHHPDLATSLAVNSIDLSSDSVVQLKKTILPRSIVSIDVGIRNLAWVELSSRGEILRWSVDDLLGVVGPETELAGVGEGNLPDEAPTKAIHETTIAKKKAKRSKKAPAPQYDPRSVALRLDQIMQTIIDSEQIEGVIVERQRFRTGGMHSVLDATFKCGVVEGMIHTWLAIWEKGRLPGILDNKRKDVVIESISPRAVATWWNIGSGTRSSDGDSSTEASTDSDSEVDTNLNVSDAAAKESKKVPKYATKKKLSRAIVDGWIQKLEDEERRKTRVRDINHPLRVSCSPDIREWYRLEKKRDDLSDCLLQAVAWYEWREHAMKEALCRYSGPDIKM